MDLLYETVRSPQSCIKFDTLELELVRLLWRLERVFDRVENGYQDTREQIPNARNAQNRAHGIRVRICCF